MSQTTSWKEKLGDQIPEELGREIDAFDAQIQLKTQGKVDDKIFMESRLRRGVYGQRYDNGQRFNGSQTQPIHYPADDAGITKGPDTSFDAPGMQRIKIPFGGLSTEQMDVLADLAEEYSDAICHVTTRQDIQYHYIHVADTPDLMRRLAAVGITTREACGNSVRNVTACPLSGICRTEAFDVTPYARACAHFLLGHPDVQDFGRKFKIAFSGCQHEACGLVAMHDMGAIGVTQMVDGQVKRGFELYVGGGLGAVPHPAKLFDEFVSEEELLPTSQAIGRVFARLGEKRNRNRARIKFLVAKLGIEEFRRLVQEERKILPHDPRWTAYLDDLNVTDEEPLKPGIALNGAQLPDGFAEWYKTNVYKQRQDGYVVVTVTLPLGDITSDQLHRLAGLCRQYVKDTVRTTVEQNILLRWVSETDLPKLYRELATLGLAESGAGTIVDVTACPGTDTCRLGISSSRGLAAELRQQLAAQNMQFDDAIKNLRIKISGCFNSCGQHHVADIGFFGMSRKANGIAVPHFQVVLGGQWTQNAGAFGLAMVRVPAKRIPAVVERLTSGYIKDRQKDESFQDFIGRLGKRQVKEMLDDLVEIPPHAEAPELYNDWGDTRGYSTGDLGIGECAGAVVPLAQFELSNCETEAFEAQIHLDEGDYNQAVQAANSSMLHAAKALIKTQFLDIPEDPQAILPEFQSRFLDTQLFYDRFAQDKFARYLFQAFEEDLADNTQDTARYRIEEAQLFIEAAYRCFDRMATTPA